MQKRFESMSRKLLYEPGTKNKSIECHTRHPMTIQFTQTSHMTTPDY